MRATVVKSRNTPESFLACCIPDLETDGRVRCGVQDAFCHKGGADGGCCGAWVEGVADVSVDKGGFADAYDKTWMLVIAHILVGSC